MDDDPTEGYVDYVSEATARANGLIQTTDTSVYIGVDHANISFGRGRRSVRIESKNSYNHGLFLLDVYHMPASICGVWPAFWTMAAHRPWPELGELDIIEGVNSQGHNNIALHTREGCQIANSGDFTGWVDTYNCYVYAPNQHKNIGCKIIADQPNVYGNAFNTERGGIYAVDWTSKAIKVWFFPRQSIPADIASGRPAPPTWGLPLASFSGACNIDSYVQNQTLIMNTAFCGGWAGGVWDEDPVCSQKARTCEEFVHMHPEEFQDAFWGINSLKVYEDDLIEQPGSSHFIPLGLCFCAATFLAVIWHTYQAAPAPRGCKTKLRI
ncbi:glycosyl hydrolases family 16 domain-containing protein [Hirsutella rhossiliensis]|uniref:Glycosyl hydrolases family 16 domain-containing protein n=1 Tax=Hirsutella rhossiliensis TaxID=111463 RepID=A0A9P8N0A5_9HYPO|nr:glycosyl hydrolases family 16 domain-containing protein [Hirsutella rhossiliensis]KAH0964500.1 glycosyl hydrolases family 16 domain-containing protein [Hirsutella rhossiliensis]